MTHELTNKEKRDKCIAIYPNEDGTCTVEGVRYEWCFECPYHIPVGSE